MKILFATDQYLPTPGGISIVTQRLSIALARRGHTVAIIAPAASWEFKKENKNHVTIYRIQSLLIHKLKQLRFSPTFMYRKNIRQIIHDFKPDIIHLETPGTISGETLREAEKQNIPLIATCHIMPENIAGTLPFLPSQIGRIVGDIYMTQTIKAFNKVDLVTAPTPIGTAILRAYNLQKPSIALSNGIDLSQFQAPTITAKQKLKEKYHFPDTPIILYIGRLDKEKKVHILIEALSLLPDSLPFHAVIEGKGQQMENLLRMTRQYNLDSKTSFIGYVDEDELPILYSVATVFVMPSTAELQSLVTMEAMAMGLPVIGAHAGALPYLIKPNQNGYLFQPDDPVDLASKLQSILNNRDNRIAMSKESLKIIKEHDIDKIIKQLEDIYRQVISQHRST